jgi:membrane-bound inhibitor of C-type lysozyme
MMKLSCRIGRIAPALAVGCALIVGCERAPAGKTHVFKCSEGVIVRITFSEKDDRATMRLAGKTYRLKRVSSGSGAKYSDGKVVFWNKGDEAVIEFNGEMMHDGCRLVQ